MKFIQIISISIIISIILSLSVMADPKEICNYIKEKAEGKHIPKGMPYSNEVMNIYTLEEEIVGNLIIKDKTMETVTCTENNKPTFKVYIKDLKTAEDIFNSDNRIDAFKNKLSDKEIIIKGVKFFKKIKLSLSKIMLKFL